MTEANEVLQLKEVLAIASPFIKSIVDTFITPKLSKLKSRFNLDYKKYHIPTEEHFSEYLHRTYKRLSIINTLVFNNSQSFLKDIFIPLTINKTGTKELKRKIDSYPEELMSNYEKVLITDTAGMGKSTIVKRMFLDIIDNSIGIPILIELRRLSKDKTILEEIHEQLNSITKDFDTDLMLEFIIDGEFIILLDGYDEISLSDREEVTKDIQNLINKAPNNKYILTSRPESSLTSFGDFQEFKIEPLKKKEAFELLRKYDKQGSISSLLIQKLGEKDMKSIEEFLINPLLVSLLFTAFQHKQIIPFKKYLFYRQVYDANFESHDLTKGDSYYHEKYTKLEIDDFHRVLRHIGFSCLKNNQRIEFNKDEILKLISQAKAFCVGISFAESDFLKDLLTSVPLFAKDGVYYKWAHKSLQEYFAAQFIYLDTKEKQSQILRQLYNNENLEKFVNILDLYFDIDLKTFRNTIIHDFLLEYKSHYNSYLNDNFNIDEKDLTYRKEICFLQKPIALKIKDKNRDIDHKKLRPIIMKYKRISGSLGSPNFDKELRCLHQTDAKHILKSLFFRKKLPFIVALNDGLKYKSQLKIVHSLKNEYEAHEITDKASDPFNSVENFKHVNQLIVNTQMSMYKIDTKLALEFLDEIVKSTKLEEVDNFLLDGL